MAKRSRHPKVPTPPVIPTAPALTAYQKDEIRSLQAELRDRKLEALRLYCPTPMQEQVHQCLAHEVLVIGGNRSGKSLCTFVEDARAVTGQDPFGKYPKEDGVLVIIGKDWRHIGLVVYPALFKWGAFKIIKDEQTGEYRAFNPATDAHRKDQCKPAPPLIPPRLVKKTSWILKSAQYISQATLHNGWQIYFFSSEGSPPQGFSASRVHFDEDIDDTSWVPEMQARLVDRKGYLCWSAMPHSTNDALLNLKERADAVAASDSTDPSIVMFKLRMLDNPHLDDDEKRKSLERWAASGEDVLRMRSEGDFITDSILMYPNFDMRIHGMDRTDLPNGQIPNDWCRYAVVDPGHAVTAVLFAAVPPSQEFILLYDQLYIRQCNAQIFGEEFAKKVKHTFRAFIIDAHGGRIRDIGSGRLPVEQYTEQMVKRGVRSEITGHSFLAGCDDIPARTEATRSMLHIRPNGFPTLRVLRSALPDLEREMKRYRKRVNYVAGTAIVTDQPVTKGDVHLVQCMEYLAAYRPTYHKPPIETEEEPWWVKWRESRRKRMGLQQQAYVYLGPQGDHRNEQ
jgi:hypothetical protein